ncbi:MAG: hypothetical protein JRI95_13150 [Deltaproteobacteria bacterium]|nr:hypothetical protein [Deltaproteobacteria bacterium]
MVDLRKTAPMAVLLVAFLLVWPGKAEAAEVQVTMTVALCGAVGGFYFFLAISSGLAPGWEPVLPDSALFNREADGWRMGWPRPVFIQRDRSTCGAYLEIIKARF